MSSLSAPLEETALKDLLQKHRDLPFESLLPEELNLLIDSFIPSQSASIRAQSLLLLSKFCSDIRLKYSAQSSSDVPTAVLVRTFSTPVEARLSSAQESTTLPGLLFLTALFQVDWESACEIFSRDDFLDAVMDTLYLYPSSQEVPVAIASLLSQASGHPVCRSLIFITPLVKDWLDRSTIQTKNSALRGAAAVALVKLSRGSVIDAQNNHGGITTLSSGKPSESSSAGTDDKKSVELMKMLVMAEGRPSSPTLDAVEGLAYLTVQATAKEAVSNDATFLKCLMDLVPHRPSAPSFPASHAERDTESLTVPALGLDYGIAVIISNLCAYKPRLSDEEKQIERLRRMTTPSAKGKLSAEDMCITDQEKLDDDGHVRIRGKKLMDAGVVDALTGIIKNLGNGEVEKRTLAAQRTVARAFLSLAEEKANRGKILQGGGAKALLNIIRVSIAEISLSMHGQGDIDRLDSTDLLAIQALAKLSITSSPSAVFGPAHESYVDAIRPLAILLSHSSSSLLQRFEAVMALTNISSVTPEAAERVSAFCLISERSQSEKPPVGDIVKRVETHLLDSNIMLRRAATELVCNLVGGAEKSFDYFGGAKGSSAKSRLQILVALSDVDDMPTRLAASGALAILTSSPNTCQTLAALEMERHRVLPMLVELISPKIAREYREERPEDDEEVVATTEDLTAGDPGLLHRGVVCVHNLFANLDGKEERKNMSLEADKRGLVRALVLTIKSNAEGTNNAVILRPAAEVLKWILQSGVKLPL